MPEEKEKLIFITANHVNDPEIGRFEEFHNIKLGTYATVIRHYENGIEAKGEDKEFNIKIEQMLYYNHFIPVNWEI